MNGIEQNDPGEPEVVLGEIALNDIPMLDEDYEYIRRVKSGDPDSFEPLVEKYRAFVFGIIRSLVYDPASEEDLAQEAFLHAFKGISKFKQQSRFRTWLYRITYNVCLNHLRRKKNSRIQDDAVDFHNVIDKAPTPARSLEKAELRLIVDRIVRELPPKYRSILFLYYYEDMQYDEISELIGLPIGTVKSHLHRARQRVKKTLQDSGWSSGG